MPIESTLVGFSRMKAIRVMKGRSVRENLFVFICLSLLAAGCVDQAAQDRINARKAFEKALALVEQAQQGFVLDGNEAQIAGHLHAGTKTSADEAHARIQQADFQIYRQKLLAKAAQILESNLELGSDHQKAATRQLLADIIGSQVNDATQRATMQWATLVKQAGVMLQYKQAISRAHSRTRALDTDPSSALVRSRNDQVNTRRQAEEIQRQIQTLRAKSNAASARIQDFRDQSAEAMAESQKLRDRAVVMQGDPSYALYDESAKAQREADTFSAESQKAQAQRELYESELVILEKQLQLANDSLEQTQQQIRDIQQQGQAAQQQKNDTLREMASSVSNLDELLKDVQQTFIQEVDAPLEQAAKNIDVAVSLIGQTAQLLPKSDNRSVQLDMLARVVQKAHVLMNHVTVTAAHGRVISVVAYRARDLRIDPSGAFAEDAQQIFAKQEALTQSLQKTIDEAMGLAQQLSESADQNDPVAMDASQQAQRLIDYRQHIENIQNRPSEDDLDMQDTSQTPSEANDGTPATERRPSSPRRRAPLRIAPMK